MGGCDEVPILKIENIVSPYFYSKIHELENKDVFSVENNLDKNLLKLEKLLEEFSHRTSNWHVQSARTVLPIILAVYKGWMLKGFVNGIERIPILSKGHGSLALYIWMYSEGLLSTSTLESFGEIDSPLQPHPEARRLGIIPVSTGSLGQGLSIANGLAIASRIDSVEREITVIMGDGETDEGQVWEAASTTTSLQLNNVRVVIDRNYIQNTGFTELVKNKEPLALKWRSFGWRVIELYDGKPSKILEELERSRLYDKPTVIIVHNTKAMTIQ